MGDLWVQSADYVFSLRRSADYVDKVLIKNCKMQNRKDDAVEKADGALDESVRALGAGAVATKSKAEGGVVTPRSLGVRECKLDMKEELLFVMLVC